MVRKSKNSLFSESFLEQKNKNKKFKLIALVAKAVIKRNLKLFLCCSALSAATAILNFNVSVGFKDAFLEKEEIREENNFFESTINDLKEEKKDVFSAEELGEILRQNLKKCVNLSKENKKFKEENRSLFNSNNEQQIYEKKELIELLTSSDSKRNQRSENVNEKSYKFKFNLFGFKIFEWKKCSIKVFLTRLFIIAFFFKSGSSFLNFYLLSYSYDLIEKDLKKELFRNVLKAEYVDSSEISKNLINQFSSDLDTIASNIWFIPNRLIYIFTTIIYHILFDFNFGSEQRNWWIILLVNSMLSLLGYLAYVLYKKSAELGVIAKRNYEEDNKAIYERINNLEYIKSVSAEEYEENKITEKLNSTFRKNKRSLLYSVLAKAIPNYVILPNIPLIFVGILIAFSEEIGEHNAIFIEEHFVRYYFTVQKLNSEMSKFLDALSSIDEVSSNVTILADTVQTLNRGGLKDNSLVKSNFKEGLIEFRNAYFAYPKRPEQIILRNFNFVFERKIYGIAGKNGIGKSTITRTLLKLYELNKGEILIAGRKIEEIDDFSLRRSVCYQSNQPGKTFFAMSLGENIMHPFIYLKESHEKILEEAAKEVGIIEFINRLPKRFDTVLKENGSDLSEGQKQQISAMKIFIHDFKIYILDEILSNVAPILREDILKRIFAKIRGKTVIVIDHHYGIFNYVDEIYSFTGAELRKEKKEGLIRKEKKG